MKFKLHINISNKTDVGQAIERMANGTDREFDDRTELEAEIENFCGDAYLLLATAPSDMVFGVLNVVDMCSPSVVDTRLLKGYGEQIGKSDNDRFLEFRASKRWCIDLGLALEDVAMSKCTGYLYEFEDQKLWIQEMVRGGYHTTVGNSCQESTDLKEVEQFLFNSMC